MKDRKLHIATFGCQMNENDSARVGRLLAGLGYQETPDAEQADVIFVNTCSIRDKAEQKVYSLLGRLRPLKDKNPDLILAVGGCMAQQEGRAMIRRTPFVDIVLGTHGLEKLPELVEEARRVRGSLCQTDFDYDLVKGPDRTLVEDAGGGSIKAFLNIMQGCDNFCAYCVVPYVRGREVSRLPEDVLREAEALVGGGVREITLLGQNVNSYGRGLSPKITFAELVEKVASIKDLWRIRFTTSHPKDLSPELIRTFADVPEVAEHLHLPVQSGSNRILKAMGRGYTREKFLDQVAALREACPEIALTTDVIVGFPGETEADFNRTMDLVNTVRFDGMFSFKYSDRQGTRASKMTDKVDPAESGRRLSELQAVQKEIGIQKNEELVGRKVEVLVEGRSQRDPDQLMGRTGGNKIVNFVGPDEYLNQLVWPRIKAAKVNSLLGELE